MRQKFVGEAVVGLRDQFTNRRGQHCGHARSLVGGDLLRVADGRLELVERLGGGGMGTVWRAVDLRLHREVAVEEVRPPAPNLAEYDPEAAASLRPRVQREARAPLGSITATS